MPLSSLPPNVLAEIVLHTNDLFQDSAIFKSTLLGLAPSSTKEELSFTRLSGRNLSLVSKQLLRSLTLPRPFPAPSLSALSDPFSILRIFRLSPNPISSSTSRSEPQSSTPDSSNSSSGTTASSPSFASSVSPTASRETTTGTTTTRKPKESPSNGSSPGCATFDAGAHSPPPTPTTSSPPTLSSRSLVLNSQPSSVSKSTRNL